MIVVGKYVVLANEADWNENYDHIQENVHKPKKFPAAFERSACLDWRGLEKYFYRPADVTDIFKKLETKICELQEDQRELMRLYETN